MLPWEDAYFSCSEGTMSVDGGSDPEEQLDRLEEVVQYIRDLENDNSSLVIIGHAYKVDPLSMDMHAAKYADSTYCPDRGWDPVEGLTVVADLADWAMEHVLGISRASVRYALIHA
jgi:hypothetical protein